MVLNIDKFLSAPLQREPFDYVVVEDFVALPWVETFAQHFPVLPERGSFPLRAVSLHPAFAPLCKALQGEDLRRAASEKFQLSLQACPTLLTVRGHTGPQDGRIHRDSQGKLLTFLLYMNKDWNLQQGGNLRLLYSPTDIEAYACEVPAKAGTLVAFRCSPQAWHGHKVFEGPRKALQLNYVKNQRYALYETFRHRLSAWVKQRKGSPYAKSND